jgi:hypothetical protein
MSKTGRKGGIFVRALHKKGPMAGPRCVRAEFHLRRIEDSVKFDGKEGQLAGFSTSGPGQLVEIVGSTGSVAVNWSRYRVMVRVSQGQLTESLGSTGPHARPTDSRRGQLAHNLCVHPAPDAETTTRGPQVN